MCALRATDATRFCIVQRHTAAGALPRKDGALGGALVVKILQSLDVKKPSLSKREPG